MLPDAAILPVIENDQYAEVEDANDGLSYVDHSITLSPILDRVIVVVPAVNVFQFTPSVLYSMVGVLVGVGDPVLTMDMVDPASYAVNVSGAGRVFSTVHPTGQWLVSL